MKSLTITAISLFAVLGGSLSSLAQTDMNEGGSETSGSVSIGMQYLLGDDVAPPTIKPSSSSIDYPQPALLEKLSGSVEVAIDLDEKGKIVTMQLKRSTDTLFSAAVLDGLQGFEFVPAKKGDEPVPISIIMEIRFKTENRWTTAYSDSERDGDSTDAADSWAYVADAVLPKFDKKELYENLVFPPEAHASSLSTTIPVRALVDSNGRVVEVEVQGKHDSLLEQAAMEAVKTTSFTPGIEGGAPTQMWTLVPVQFSLHGKVRDESEVEDAPESMRGVSKPTYDLAELQSNFRVKGGLKKPVEVSLRVLINEEGKVMQVDVQGDAEYAVANAAVEAVKSTDFEPGKQNGEPIPVWTTITIKATPRTSAEPGE